MDACSWCLRLSAEPLRAGEICDVCIGLCSFAIVEQPEAAAYLYRQSSCWLEQVFSYRRELASEADDCWWCGRAGQARAQAPTLCRVCSGLLIGTPPSLAELASVRRSYEQICLAVGA